MNLQSFGISEPEVAKDQFRAAARVAASMGWHVHVYANLKTISAVADEMATAGVPVVIDHFGLAHSTLGIGQPGFDVLILLQEPCGPKIRRNLSFWWMTESS